MSPTRAEPSLPIHAASRKRMPPWARGKRITVKDVAYFTRQLSTLLRAGVPLLQSIDLIARGHAKPGFTRLLKALRFDIESGSGLAQAFRRHPQHFDALYCNLIDAGEQSGALDALLERLSLYLEQSIALKARIRSAMLYPISVLAVACLVMAVLMIFVVPVFKDVFSSFGASLPAATLVVIGISDGFVQGWPFILSVPGIGAYLFARALKRSETLQRRAHGLLLKAPILGALLRQAIVARWTRTLATLFAAGTPLIEAMESVAGVAGNWIYRDATLAIRQSVRAGISLTDAMRATRVFDAMLLQMTQIGEESGTLDTLLLKAAEFYEHEIDDAVANLSALIEPIIIVALGTLIGGLVIAMYLPIFKLGQIL